MNEPELVSQEPIDPPLQEEIQTVVAAPVEEPDLPDAVEIKPGEKYVPVGALKAVRDENKTLKAKAERADALESELNAARPFAEFLRNNPHLMQPIAPAPVAPTSTEPDPELVDLAKALDLYDAAGQPDVARAERVARFSDKRAEKIADQRMAPVQEQSNETRAAANLQHLIANVKDGDGKAVEEQYVVAAVKSITGQVDKGTALKILADPNVVRVIGLTALGLQATAKKTQPRGAEHPPLVVESAGGSSEIQLNDFSKKLAKATGRTEKQYADSAKKYVPGRANALE